MPHIVGRFVNDYVTFLKFAGFNASYRKRLEHKLCIYRAC